MAKLPIEVTMYIRAYERLRDLTPIAADCGELCGKRCCKGDEHAGMLLFPHEELLLADAGYRIETRTMRGRTVRFAVCDGTCKRRLRPLSCRIYPFAPVLRDGAVEVIPDPRAKPFCPLLLPEAAEFILPAFTDEIQKVFTSLVRSPSIYRFLLDYTAMLDDYTKFWM